MKSTICPTVKIKSKDHEDGVIINESDFDPKKHELFDVPAKKAETKSTKRGSKVSDK